MVQPHQTSQSPPVPLLIVAHCSTIHRKNHQFDQNELSAILDDSVRELQSKNLPSHIYFNALDQIVQTLNVHQPPVLSNLTSHYFFVLVRNSVEHFLRKLHRSFHLNDEDIFRLRNSVLLLENAVERTGDVSKLLHWITNTNFLYTFAQCLNSIKKIIHKDRNHRVIKQLTRLLNIFCHLQERVPIDQHQTLFVPLYQPTVDCLMSSTYVKLFQELKPDAESLNNLEKFFLIKCPYFLTSYNGPPMEESIKNVLQTMLPRYVTIFDQHMKTIEQWTRPMMRAIHNLLITMIYAEGYFSYHTNDQAFRSLIDHLLSLLDQPRFRKKIRSQSNNLSTLVIDATLVVFSVLVDEPNALGYIKQRKPIAIFQQLTSAPRETIVLNAYLMLAYIIDENDIRSSSIDVPQLARTVLDHLQNSVQRLRQISKKDFGYQEEVRHNIVQLIETSKCLAQYERIRQEILKLNAVSGLIYSYRKLNNLPKKMLLDYLWTLSFNEKIAKELRRHSSFIASLEKIVTTASSPSVKTHSEQVRIENGLKKVSNGLLWTLVEEPQHRAKLQKSSNDSKNHQKTIYDIMISYSKSDREIVHQIKQYLNDKNLHVWIDHHHSQEQGWKAVGNTIENSSAVLLCISDAFKRDNRCQAIVQYAHHCNRPLLPIIVRKGTRSDGWLTPFVRPTVLINLATSDFKLAMESLLKEVNHHHGESHVKPRTPSPRSETYNDFALGSTTEAISAQEISIAMVSTATLMDEKQYPQQVESVRTISRPFTPEIEPVIVPVDTVQRTVSRSSTLTPSITEVNTSIDIAVYSKPASHSSTPVRSIDQQLPSAPPSIYSRPVTPSNSSAQVSIHPDTTDTVAKPKTVESHQTDVTVAQLLPPAENQQNGMQSMFRSQSSSTITSDSSLGAANEHQSNSTSLEAAQIPVQSSVQTPVRQPMYPTVPLPPTFSASAMVKTTPNQPMGPVVFPAPPPHLSSSKDSNPTVIKPPVPNTTVSVSTQPQGATYQKATDHSTSHHQSFRSSDSKSSESSDSSDSSDESQSVEKVSASSTANQPIPQTAPLARPLTNGLPPQYFNANVQQSQMQYPYAPRGIPSQSIPRPVAPAAGPPLRPANMGQRLYQPTQINSQPMPRPFGSAPTGTRQPVPISGQTTVRPVAPFMNARSVRSGFSSTPLDQRPPMIPGRPVSASYAQQQQQQRMARNINGNIVFQQPAQAQAQSAMPGIQSSKTLMSSNTNVINHSVTRGLPDLYTKRQTSNAAYRSLPLNAWTKNDVLDYLFDSKLHPLMPICEAMSGPAFARLFQMCQEHPSRVFNQLNNELRSRFNGLSLTMEIYAQYLAEMHKLLGLPVEALAQLITPKLRIIQRVAPPSVPSKEPSNTFSTTEIITQTTAAAANTMDKYNHFTLESADDSSMSMKSDRI